MRSTLPRISTLMALENHIRHLLVDAHGCRGPLDDADGLLALMHDAAQAAGARPMGEASARYVPHGVTAVLFLAESHILISTWPERNMALIDVLVCSDRMDLDKAWEVIAAGLQTDQINEQRVIRGKDEASE